MTTAIEIKDLHVRYGDGDDAVEALHGLNLTIEAGEKVAIIGRSGGGKSSLLRILGGLITPSSGQVRIGDRVLSPGETPTRDFYSQVGLVFQNYGLVPQLTAMQNVLTGRLHDHHAMGALARFSPDDHHRAHQLLVELGLGDRLHLRVSRLSGGEQQRVALARLLFQRPAVRLLDEPVASLDVHWANRAVEMMTHRDEESTVIMVLHDLPMAREYADRVILIHHGEVLFDGDPDEGCRRLETLSTPPSTDGSVDSGATAALPANAASPLSNSLTESGKNPCLRPDKDIAPDDDLGGLWGKTSFYAIVALAIIALYTWAALGVDFSLSRIFSNWEHAVDFVGRMLPPDFGVSATIAESLIETVQMALIGTTLAAIVSLPLAVMAARNISSRPLQAGARLVLNTLRTIPSIIWGLFFVAIVGLGPFPGILALTFYAAGYLGKFYYEGIESIDPGPLESLRTVGASPLQRFRWGVFPQVLPLMLGYTLYMLEYNVRAASILGIVGAGGIGFYLYTYINNFQYDRAATALLFLLVVVTIIDSASSRLRARLMG